MPKYADVDKLLDYLDAKAFAALQLCDGGSARNAYLAAMDAVAHSEIVDAVSKAAYDDLYAKYCELARLTNEEFPKLMKVLREFNSENVRRGRWEHGMRCPYCGQVDLAKPNYCCNCGAKMTEGDTDG